MRLELTNQSLFSHMRDDAYAGAETGWSLSAVGLTPGFATIHRDANFQSESTTLWARIEASDYQVSRSADQSCLAYLISPAKSNHNIFVYRRRRASFKAVRDAIQALEAMSGQYAQQSIENLEASWLTKNRMRYAGEWIALQGDNLIEHSATPEIVFAAARGLSPKPLVMQIERDELPFGGW